LIAALISVALIAGATIVGGEINNKFAAVGNAMSSTEIAEGSEAG